jgi:hypothetical protein
MGESSAISMTATKTPPGGLAQAYGSAMRGIRGHGLHVKELPTGRSAGGWEHPAGQDFIQAFYRLSVFTSLLQFRTGESPLTCPAGGTTLPLPHEKLLLACRLGLSAVCAPLSAQIAPKAAADAPLTPEEAKKLQVVMTKATASPEAKAAEENLRKAREELAKATQAYQTSVEKAAIDADPAAAPVIEKTRRLQQEALARRSAGKPAGSSAVASAPVRRLESPHRPR